MAYSPQFHRHRQDAVAQSVAWRSEAAASFMDRASSVEDEDEEDDDDDTVGVQCSLAWRPMFTPLSDAAQGGPMPTEIIWMPLGNHEVHAGDIDGVNKHSLFVTVDYKAFLAVQKDFDFLKDGAKVFIDLNHSNTQKDIAAWVKEFSWDEERGIIAHLEWTPLGEAAVRTKSFTSFSPTFAWNKLHHAVMGLVADLKVSTDFLVNGGGLVNDPAFRAMPKLSF